MSGISLVASLLKHLIVVCQLLGLINLLRPGVDALLMPRHNLAPSTDCNANVLQDLAQSFLSSWPTGIMTITLKLL